jgi:predicted HicB family RNase H-like nuclease
MKTLHNDFYSYRVIWSEEDKEYIGLCTEFPSLSWLAKTPEGALHGIREIVGETIEDMKKNNEVIPLPVSSKRYSGKFIVRVPPEVHRRLALEAAESGVSLNRLASARLSHLKA